MLNQLPHKRILICALAVASILCGQVDSHVNEASLHTMIDQHINAGFAPWKVSAAERCSDADFIRRVTLDLTGAVPTADATRKFLANTNANKRIQLVDRLATPPYLSELTLRPKGVMHGAATT
jgi:hypothetical protein